MPVDSRPRRAVLKALWGLGLAAGGLGAGAAPGSVVIVSSEGSASYQAMSALLVAALVRLGVRRQDAVAQTLPQWESDPPETPRLFVALGTPAAEKLVQTQRSSPVLCALLPKQSFERVLRDAGRRTSPLLSAVVLDQPFSRQLDLIRLALPQTTRLAVLYGPDSASQAGSVRDAVRALGWKEVGATLAPGEPVFPALKALLDDADVLLAVPDPLVYNSNSIQNILLSSYRKRVPMVAFSPGYARAGALMALHSDQEQMARQIAALVVAALGGRGLPGAVQYPVEFVVSINEPVARSLGLDLDAQALRQRLMQSERKP